MYKDIYDGVFWISLDDFIEYFNYVSICKTDLELKTCRFIGKFTQTGSNLIKGYSLQLNEKATFDIELFHNTKENRKEKEFIDLNLIVIFNYGKADEKYILSNYKFKNKNYYIETFELNKGTYTFLPLSFKYSNNNNYENNNYTIVFHSLLDYKIRDSILPINVVNKY
jgi:hypothetical protein